MQPHIKCRDVSGDERIAKVSIVGMIKITVVIEEKYTELAVRVLRKAFELDQK